MLTTLRTYYFFIFGVNGALFPVLPLVLSLRGLSPSEVGWVMTVNPVLGAILPPIWGAFADRHRQREKLLRFVSVASAIAVLLLALPATVSGSMAAMAVFCVFRSPIMSLVDATTYDALGRDARGFGKVRVWGSLGFVAATTLTGALGAASRPMGLFAACSALFAICAAVATTLPAAARPVAAPKVAPLAAPKAAPLGRGALAHALDPHLLPLLVTNVLYYGAHAMFDVFFMLHVKSLGRGEGFASLGWGIGVLVEIAVMLLARRIFYRFDAGKVIVFCGATAVVRWFGTAAIESPAPMIALQALHGVTFGLWYLALVGHVHERVPEEARTSVQGILLASLATGTALGCVFGGRLVETFGSAAAFQAAGLVTLVATAMYALRLRYRAPAALPAEASPGLAPKL